MLQSGQKQIVFHLLRKQSHPPYGSCVYVDLNSSQFKKKKEQSPVNQSLWVSSHNFNESFSLFHLPSSAADSNRQHRFQMDDTAKAYQQDILKVGID